MSQLIKVVVPRVTTVGKRLPTVWRLNQTLTKKQHPDEPEDSRIEVFDHWLSSNDGIQPKTWSVPLKTIKEHTQLTASSEEIEKIVSHIQLYCNTGVYFTGLCKQNISSLYTE